MKQGCSSCPTMEGFKPSAEWTIGGAASLLEIDSDEFTIADGNTFYVELAVRNHAGLEATVITDGVTVGAFHATMCLRFLHRWAPHRLCRTFV